MLAKICSDMNKPNGQTELKNDANEIKKFLESLPIGKVSGIGKVAERTLNELGIKTCGELKENMVYIKELFKSASYQFLLQASLGIGKTSFDNNWERKSISVERTFSNISTKQELYAKLQEISFKLAEDIKKENLKGKSVTLKLKTSAFEILTRCLTISKYIYKEEDLFKIGKKILNTYLEEHPNQSYRLMGLRLSSFLDEKHGKSLDNYVKVVNDKNAVDILIEQKKYECPVCYKTVKVDNIIEFEKHVNECLCHNEEDLKNDDFYLKYNKESNKKIKLDKDNNHISKKSINSDDIYIHKKDNKEKLYIKNEQNNNNIPNSKIEKDKNYNSLININSSSHNNYNKIKCPVCESTISCSSNEELNRHIDICLNNDIIKNYK